ncbi:hypothetical protein EYZ11_008398 [Aspergillus tanneri]|uniref:Carbon-nitrogen hydrolase n=1 Tax=Aspergillus tanneri TaxID=1220188 RepID=A0A4S3JAR3_9EURO|nr:Carbon-nitrogen hydrolase [Aspergillus tanneri]KAA8641847.1 Carbon-nitrogen hydrolase [Aspergillus tanneri]THC92130.1 hypothetical protein EYZ11_008398 [Aspergillus tanneri]
MRIATLQFAPKLGDVEGNIQQANELLQHGKLLGSGGPGTGIRTLRPDILVLPELALTGYNFPSLDAIKPYLERMGQGPSTNWAQETAKQYQCKVCVGYPEIEKTDATQGSPSGEKEKCYNSLLVVDENGEVILNYRKTFLYYTDETWAAEGNAKRSFHELTLTNKGQGPGSKVATSFGICMDINPYRFEAPFTDWEFANRVLDSKTQLVVLSMAWLTLLSREELASLANKPDMDTFNYWIQRFIPLIRKKMGHDFDIDNASETESDRRIVIVFANRVGEEQGSDGASLARYAGTSAIIAIRQRLLPVSADQRSKTRVEKSPDEPEDGDRAKEEMPPMDVKIHCWNMMGAATEGICFADTTTDPNIVFELVRRL